MTRAAARTGILAAFVLAVGLLAAPASAQSSAVTQAPAASASCTTSRPHSGTILYEAISGGMGQLTIENGLSQDGVVVLVLGRSRAISVYVRDKAKITVHNVKEGTYTIYFTTGYHYSACQGRFTEDAAYYRFDKHAHFVAPPYYTIASLTLNPVKGGNAPTSQIGPQDFPA
jgi:hypothetical protein